MLRLAIGGGKQTGGGVIRTQPGGKVVLVIWLTVPHAQAWLTFKLPNSRQPTARSQP